MLTKALLLLAPALYGQSVEGLVTNSVTHEPIPGAVVFLGAPGGNNLREQTDESGAFRLNSVQPGDYLVYVFKEGFDAPLVPPRIHVDAAAALPSLRLTMTRWPALRGRVLDPERSPAPQVPVQLIAANGDRTASTVTDNEGRFQFDALRPGLYTLLARPLTAADADDDTQLAPTYFPNVTERSDAASIVVTSGAPLSGFEIGLRSVPVFRVAGRALDEHGEPAPGAVLQVSTADTHFAKVTAGEDGAFEFRKVRAGAGSISAEFRRGEAILRGAASIHVGARHLESVVVRVSPPVAVVADVELDARPVSYQGMAFLIPSSGSGNRIGASIVGASISFRDIYPGRYRIFLMPKMEGAYVDAVLLGELDIALQDFEVNEGMLPVRIVMKSGGGSVHGTAASRTDAMAVLIPREERLRQVPFLVNAPCSEGRFVFDHVRPGEYYVLVIDPAEPTSFANPIAARTRIEASPTVRVENGSVASIEVHP